MATMLKNLRLTSVDLVRAGANQNAEIRIAKSEDDGIFKRFANWLRQPSGSDNQEQFDMYTDVLRDSFHSILNDDDVDDRGKAELLRKSLRQFSDATNEMITEITGEEDADGEEVEAEKGCGKRVCKDDMVDEIEEI